jgi:hypothetical protein
VRRGVQREGGGRGRQVGKYAGVCTMQVCSVQLCRYAVEGEKGSRRAAAVQTRQGTRKENGARETYPLNSRCANWAWR